MNFDIVFIYLLASCIYHYLFVIQVYIVQATIQSTTNPSILISEYFAWDTYIPATFIFVSTFVYLHSEWFSMQ